MGEGKETELASALVEPHRPSAALMPLACETLRGLWRAVCLSYFPDKETDIQARSLSWKMNSNLICLTS